MSGEDLNPPPAMVAPRDKANVVRDIAKAGNITFTEHEVQGRADLVRFKFDIDFADAQDFLSTIPLDAFAHRGIITGS